MSQKLTAPRSDLLPKPLRMFGRFVFSIFDYLLFQDGNNADQMSPSNSDNDLAKTGTNENNFTKQNNVNMATYEMSVTNKENALINSFSNLIEHQPSHPTLNIQEFNAQNAKTNGKSDVDATNDGNLIIKSAISNGNGHTDHSLDNEL